MSIDNAFDGARNKVAALSLATLVAFSGAANANENVHKASFSSAQQCAPLYETSTGRKIDASYSAYKYSQENVGAVGISIFPGQDLSIESADKFAADLRTIFLNNNIEAQCYVHNEVGKNGTGVDFKIAGIPWNENEATVNVVEAKSPEVLRAVANKARSFSKRTTQSDTEKAPTQPTLAMNQ